MPEACHVLWQPAGLMPDVPTQPGGRPMRRWIATAPARRTVLRQQRITVAGPEIVGVRLTQAAYAHGLALALPEKVEMARPTGVGRALATYEMPIEGRDEWLAAARRLA
jgi:hypothetical protein